MTDLLSRPLLHVQPSRPEPTRPLAVSVLLAVGWCTAMGLVGCIALAVAVWFFGESGSFETAVRSGALGWLFGHGSGLVVEGSAITATPVGMLCLWGYLLHRGGRWAGAHSMVRGGADLGVGVAALVAGYAGVGGAVAMLTASETVHATVLRSVVTTALLALAAGGVGVVRGAGRLEGLAGRLPVEVRAAARGGAAGAAALAAAAAALMTAGLLLHFPDVVALFEAAGVDLLGGVVLALFCLAVLPNAVLNAGAFLAGPGFLLGTGTSVAPDRVELGAVPSFPLLGALPQAAVPAPWYAALIALPVLAGGLAGVVAVRHHRAPGLGRAALRGGLGAAFGGALFGVLTGLATGSVGPGRMQDVGPDVVATTGVCALAFLAGGVVTATGVRWWADGRRRSVRPTGAAKADQSVSAKD